MTLHELAEEYRAESDLEGGFVILYAGEVCGWISELDRPGAWMPGCIALDVSGKKWRAEEGNDYDGAKCWVEAS